MSNTNIKNYSMFCYTKDLYINGLSLMIMNIDDKVVSGIRIKINSMEKFSMKRSEFEALIHADTIKFVEVVPKFVRSEYSKIFNA